MITETQHGADPAYNNRASCTTTHALHAVDEDFLTQISIMYELIVHLRCQLR